MRVKNFDFLFLYYGAYHEKQISDSYVDLSGLCISAAAVELLPAGCTQHMCQYITWAILRFLLHRSDTCIDWGEIWRSGVG